MPAQDHHLILTNQPSSPAIPALGQRVQIVRGSLKGETGVITGYTSENLYFIWRDCDPSVPGCIPIPDGPFLPDEFVLQDNPDME